MRELDHKEGRALKNWCFWIVMLKILKSPLDRDQILYFSHWCKGPTHWNILWCWERWRVEGEGVREEEMIGWLHWLDGHEFEQTTKDSEGQESLECCSPWGHKELDMSTDWTTTIDLCSLPIMVIVLVFYDFFPQIRFWKKHLNTVSVIS